MANDMACMSRDTTALSPRLVLLVSLKLAVAPQQQPSQASQRDESSSATFIRRDEGGSTGALRLWRQPKYNSCCHELLDRQESVDSCLMRQASAGVVVWQADQCAPKLPEAEIIEGTAAPFPCIRLFLLARSPLMIQSLIQATTGVRAIVSIHHLTVIPWPALDQEQQQQQQHGRALQDKGQWTDCGVAQPHTSQV